MSVSKHTAAAVIAGLSELEKIYATATLYEGLTDQEFVVQYGLDAARVEQLQLEVARALASSAEITGAEAGAVRGRAESALRDRLTRSASRPLDRKGRAWDLEDVVLSTIPPDALAKALGDVGQGDGGELRQPKDGSLAPRFHSARSSCALAVNAFGLWRLNPTSLVVAGSAGLNGLEFERKCPIEGISGHYALNLDVLATSEDGIVAVESKLIEYLDIAKPAIFDPIYAASVKELADPTWEARVRRLQDNSTEFRFFGAMQVIKHYLGLRSCFPNESVRLLYVVWEPADGAMHRLFEQHRAEVAAFATDLDDPWVTFSFLTYRELFEEWSSLSSPVGLQEHLRLLRDRYELSIF